MAKSKPSKNISLKDKMAMEKEHGKSKSKQKRIVKQHEAEHGKSYYPALKKMESKLPKPKKKR